MAQRVTKRGGGVFMKGSSQGGGAAFGVALCGFWLGVWQVASMLFGSALIFPGPVVVTRRLVELVMVPATWLVLGASAVRVVAGLLLGFVCALPLALVAHRFALLKRVVEPPLMVLKSTPVACAIVLLLLWLGSSSVATAVVFLVVFPALYFSVLEALGSVDAKVSELLQVMRVASWRRFMVHTWPQVVPFLMSTLKNACGMAWKAGVAAEVIGSPSLGVGERVYHAKLLLETADVFAWTSLVILAAFVLERCVLALVELSVRASRGLALVGLGEKDQPLRMDAAGQVLCRDLVVGYDEGPAVIDGLTLCIAAGEVACLADASGAGKTTLLRTLAGLLPARAGVLEGFDAVSLACQEARLIEELSAVQNVLLCAGRACSRERARTLLARVLPDVGLDQPVSQLSGGQRRRVELVRALATPSAAVLLDEPFAGLDEDAMRACAQLVLAEAAGRPVVVATHGLSDIEALGGTAITLG